MAKRNERKTKDFSKGSGKSKSSKGSKFRSNDRKDDNTFESNSRTHNDVSWYTADSQILNDVARLPYSIPTGVPFSRPYVSQGNVGVDWSIPGIMKVGIMPTLGYAIDPTDPVNVAAQGVYSFVRHLNSGARNYDPVDLMIYIGALDSVYSCISWATRLYATICSYSQGNRYTPRLLVEAQGVDFQNLADNMVAFRSQLNQRIAKASQLMVPKVMPLFERHRWMFSNYYIEGDTMKDQIYFYAPIGFYKFQLDSDDAGMLKAYSLKEYSNSLQYTDIIQMLDDMLNPIIEDEDFNIMSGDIFKAYQGNIVTASLLPDLVAMNFTYDENVLLQIKNCKCKSVLLDSNNHFLGDFFDVTQDSSKRYLIVNNSSTALTSFCDPFYGTVGVGGSSPDEYKHAYDACARVWTKPILLTSPHAVVTADENMVSTRGTMAAELTMQSSYLHTWDREYYGSEWYHNVEIYVYVRRRTNNAIATMKYNWEYANAVAWDFTAWGVNEWNTYGGELFNAISSLSKFKFHPEAFLEYGVKMGNGYANGKDFLTSFFDVDNYSSIDYNVVKGLHDAALLGEYNIPRIALLPS